MIVHTLFPPQLKLLVAAAVFQSGFWFSCCILFLLLLLVVVVLLLLVVVLWLFWSNEREALFQMFPQLSADPVAFPQLEHNATHSHAAVDIT